MAVQRVVRRSGNDDLGGSAWNGLVDMCGMEPISSFTPVQRVAHLAFWYMSEVNNGGHFQYFLNKEYFDHAEVVSALRSIGADTCAAILSAAIVQFEAADLERPRSLEEYIEAEAEAAMSDLDRRYHEIGDAEFQAALQRYLDANESEFIRWVE